MNKEESKLIKVCNICKKTEVDNIWKYREFKEKVKFTYDYCPTCYSVKVNE